MSTGEIAAARLVVISLANSDKNYGLSSQVALLRPPIKLT